MQANENIKNMLGEFYCDTCDYKCSKSSSWSQHLLTAKHHKAKTGLKQAIKIYACDICSMKFNHQSSFCRHKKKAHPLKIEPPNEPTDKSLIFMLLKQNSQLIEQNAELVKNGTHNTTNNNSHNKTFNLQFFLNETCKDAMNITDFVNNIQLQLSDLEKMGEVGYVNGLSNIIVKNLKDMDVSSRPIHCTDSKREIMYIKDEDKWDKELNGNPKVRNAIKHIAHKNSKLLIEFKEKHPDYNNSSSKVSDKYNKLLIESMGGKGDNDVEKENKIIRNITKEIIVEKE